MKQFIALMSLFVLLASCDSIKEKTKNTINKSGETVGKTATEFFEGVDKSLQCEITLSQELIDKGLSTGKFSIENNPDGGYNNVLTLYLIFDKDFQSPLSIKAYDKNGLEVGRTKLEVQGKSGDAGYYDFKFDKRTYIEVRSKLIIE